MSQLASSRARLARRDRFLPLWIFVVMAAGIGLGRVSPALGPHLDAIKLGTAPLPIALVLLAVMYPVLAKVRYQKLGELHLEGRLWTAPLVPNRVVDALLMFGLAWTLLSDLPRHRDGPVLLGLGRCIAMALVACSSRCVSGRQKILSLRLRSGSEPLPGSHTVPPALMRTNVSSELSHPVAIVIGL